MTLEVHVETHPLYIVVKFKGSGPAKDFERHNLTLVLQCQRAQVRKCLSDMTAAQYSFTPAERYQLAKSMAVVGDAGIKLAVLMLPPQVNTAPEPRTEQAVQQSGLQMRVFTEQALALTWLLQAE